MATVQVESLRLHTYNGVERPEGTVYDAEDTDLETLKALTMARPVSEKPPEPKA